LVFVSCVFIVAIIGIAAKFLQQDAVDVARAVQNA